MRVGMGLRYRFEAFKRIGHLHCIVREGGGIRYGAGGYLSAGLSIHLISCETRRARVKREIPGVNVYT